MSRPDDFAESSFEGGGPVRNPDLGVVGWLRWGWRQLTSMRTALLLLLALALAAVPGSLIPQSNADPNGVVSWKQSYPQWVDIANGLQLFTVYTSVWFSAIYLLLFVSLVGCVIPRTKHHLQAMRAAPPRTPARLGRLAAFQQQDVSGARADALDQAERLLRRQHYRVARYGESVSAERGYLRETGNLVFHLSLVGILIAVFIGGAFGFTGQRILVVGQTFVNYQAGYDSLNAGSLATNASLEPYSLTLLDLKVTYDTKDVGSLGMATDYTARVRVTDPQGKVSIRTIKVNEPLSIGGTNVYLLGNGYAPHITVRDASGKVVFSDSVPFLPQDSKLTSLGVLKVPAATPDQLGMIGFLYPTVGKLTTGAFTSVYPDLLSPLLTLNVYKGNLGINSATSDNGNVYSLNTDKLTPIAARNLSTKPLEIGLGKTVKLPEGRGTVRFDSVARYASFDIHHDPTQLWVLAFALLTVAGLLTSVLVPRRRLWMRIDEEHDGVLRLQYAGLARGDDPGLERAVADFAQAHARAVADESGPKASDPEPARLG